MKAQLGRRAGDGASEGSGGVGMMREREGRASERRVEAEVGGEARGSNGLLDALREEGRAAIRRIVYVQNPQIMPV